MAYIGVPRRPCPLALLRPVSGGAATAVAADIIKSCGADSLAGAHGSRHASARARQRFTSLPFISARQDQNTRHAIPAALLADLAVFMLSAWSCHMLWG